MTKHINGNTYEFPSEDMHRTIINKLILHEKKGDNLVDFFNSIKIEYDKLLKNLKSGASQKTKNMECFIAVFERFMKDVEEDIMKDGQIHNIDGHMQDLRKNAIKEYEEVRKCEIEIVCGEKNIKPDNSVFE